MSRLGERASISQTTFSSPNVLPALEAPARPLQDARAPPDGIVRLLLLLLLLLLYVAQKQRVVRRQLAEEVLWEA